MEIGSIFEKLRFFKDSRADLLLCRSSDLSVPLTEPWTSKTSGPSFVDVSCLPFHFLLQHDITNCKMQIESLEAQYRARMEVLKETVASKTAVPTAQVYVSFYLFYN